jgi:hypothetical protein
MGPPVARRRRPPVTLRHVRKDETQALLLTIGVLLLGWLKPERAAGELEERRLGPDSNRKTTTGIVSGLSQCLIEFPRRTHFVPAENW